MKGLILWQLLSNSDFRTGTITSSAFSKGQTSVPKLLSMTMLRSFSAMFSAESIVSTTGRDLSRRTKMIDTKCELTVARTMLSAKVEVVLRRESRERHIREKALRAYAERKKPKEQRKQMTAEERRAVMNSLKNLNK